MTCNQLILLCQIYNGTLDREVKIGTYGKDIIYLERIELIERAFVVKKLIVPDSLGDRWITTNKGKEFIERILETI
jgi:nucleoside-triphosphatase THEP1